MLGLATLAAYANSFTVPFLFDDVPSIVENPALRDPWSALASPTRQTGGLTTSGRPVLALSLALNHAIAGHSVWSYHATNLAIHLAAGLCLFGLARRTLLLPVWHGRFTGTALPLAFLIAGLWLLHPLQTESVTYIVQRAESLAGCFGLMTLYAFVRAAEAGRHAGWTTVAAAACALGVASKESVAAVPLLVFLYDRAFVSGSLRGAWVKHRGVHLMLFASWIVLAALVVSTGGRGGTAGLDTTVSSWSYALTQCRAIVHYLRLALWPDALVFDYGVATEAGLLAVLPQALAVVGAVALVLFALVRWPKAGWVGAWFLGLLGPSSSFVPVVTQTAAEHRLYLALAGPVAAAGVVAFQLLGRRVFPAGVAAILALALATFARNQDYRSEAAIWGDTARKLPTNPRAHNNLGQALFRAGKTAEAIACYERAVTLQPDYAEPHYNLGVARVALGSVERGIADYETALRSRPAYPEAHNNLGNALIKLGRVAEALPHYQQAIALKPDFAEAHSNLGNALLQSGRTADAVPRFQRALELRPDYPEAHYNLGNARAAAGAMAAAIEEYGHAVKAKPDYVEALVNRGNALLSLGRPAEALPDYERAIALRPDLADAHYNLGAALLELERWSDAVPRFEGVLRLNPAFGRAHHGLGFALAKTGRLSDAVRHYEAYLRFAPDDAGAREELRQLRALGAGAR